MLGRVIPVAMMLAACVPALAIAQTTATPGSLRLGDPAPPLAIGSWLGGEPVQALEADNVYAIILVATWTPVLQNSVPGLNALHERLTKTGVKLLVVCVRENSRSAPEMFVKLRGRDQDAITFPLATDDVPRPPAGTRDDRAWATEQGRMSSRWLRASGRDALPSAYLVDRRGRVAWFGNPLYPRGEMDEALRRVLADDLTPEQAAELSRRYQDRQQRIEAAEVRYRSAVTSREHREAADAVAELIDLAEPDALPGFYSLRLQILLTRVNDERAAYAFARDALTGPHKDNPYVLYAIAVTILDAQGVGRRDFALAQRIAEAADKLTGGTNPMILDLLARTHFERGDPDRAVEIDSRALDLARQAADAAPDDPKPRQVLNTIQANLERFRDAIARKNRGG